MAPPDLTGVPGLFLQYVETPPLTFSRVMGIVIKKFAMSFFVVALWQCIFSIILFGLYLYYKTNCPINPRIPIYMFVAGLCGIIVLVLFICFLITSKFIDEESTEWTLLDCCYKILSVIICIIVALTIIWFILGCIWVFNIRDLVQHNDETKSNYCQKILYNGTYIFLRVAIGAYIGAAVCAIWLVVIKIVSEREMYAGIRSYTPSRILSDIGKQLRYPLLFQPQHSSTCNTKPTSTNSA